MSTPSEAKFLATHLAVQLGTFAGEKTKSPEKSMFSFRYSDDVPYVHYFGWNGGVAKIFWGEVCLLFCCLGNRL